MLPPVPLAAPPWPVAILLRQMRVLSMRASRMGRSRTAAAASTLAGGCPPPRDSRSPDVTSQWGHAPWVVDAAIARAGTLAISTAALVAHAVTVGHLGVGIYGAMVVSVMTPLVVVVPPVAAPVHEGAALLGAAAAVAAETESHSATSLRPSAGGGSASTQAALSVPLAAAPCPSSDGATMAGEEACRPGGAAACSPPWEGGGCWWGSGAGTGCSCAGC